MFVPFRPGNPPAGRRRPLMVHVALLCALLAGAVIGGAAPAQALGAPAPTFVPAAPVPMVNAATTIQCTAGYVYGVSSTGQLQEVSAGTVTPIGTRASGVASFNGLGIGTGGSPVLAYERTNAGRTATMFSFDPNSGTWSNTGDAYNTANDGYTGQLVAGAVDLKTGAYYFGGFSSSGTSFYLWRYNPGSTPRFTFMGTLNTSANANSASNGDMAFDAAGNLFVVRGVGSTTTVFSVTAANLAGGTGGTIPSSTSNSFTTNANVNGVAFDASGKAYLGTGNTVTSYDMPNWTNPSTVASSTSGYSGTDLASCSSPATITLEKDVQGRVNDTDQFTLNLAQGSTTLGTATTTGTATGVQSERVGPLPAVRGTTVTFSETGAGGTSLSGYTSSYQCTVDGQPMSPAVSGTGTSGSVTIPATGQEILCRIVNSPRSAAVTVNKTWVVDGTSYANGQQPAGISATPSLTPAGTGTGSVAWGQRRTGFTLGQNVGIGETTVIDPNAFPGCTLSSATISGPGVNGTQAIGQPTTVKLPGTENVYQVTNTVTCQSLTVIKNVKNTHGGTRSATDWNGHLKATQGQNVLSYNTGQKRYVATGSWVISEDLLAGYEQAGITCQGGTLAADGKTVSVAAGVNVTCTITNQDQAGSVTWKKADESGRALAGSVWTLTGPGGATQEVTDCVAASAASCTGADKDPAAGAFSLAGLNLGDYTLVEKSAPAGYVLDTTPHRFTLTSDRKDFAFTTAFKNVQRAAVTLPLTGGTGSDLFTLGGLAVLLGAGATAFVLHRRRAAKS